MRTAPTNFFNGLLKIHKLNNGFSMRMIDMDEIIKIIKTSKIEDFIVMLIGDRINAFCQKYGRSLYSIKLWSLYFIKYPSMKEIYRT